MDAEPSVHRLREKIGKSMRKKFFETLRDGKEYSEIWPQKAELSVVFPEERVIKLTQYLMSIMPMLAVVILAFHYQFAARLSP